MPFSNDDAFDGHLPPALQIKASAHFTPIHVARHAAALLAAKPGTSVLDVGSGVGKFCIAGALAAPQSRFVGVEWRPHLVELASELARAAGVVNATFICGDALDLNWSDYDSFYFYNPFAEQRLARPFVLDDTVPYDPNRYPSYVIASHERLAIAKLGTRVATYHGLGLGPPRQYDVARSDVIGTDRVELWIKTRATECVL